MFKEILATVGLIIILGILFNPFNFYQSNMMLASLVTSLIVLYVFFVIVISKDKPKDEREEKHYNLASDAAFISGTTILTIGIIIQSFKHELDLWIVLALIVMVITKTIFKKRYQNCC